MSMQVTSRARRVYKIRGSQAVPSGRPRQDGKVTKQLVITDNNEELKSEGKSYKMDVAGIFSPFILYFVFVSCAL